MTITTAAAVLFAACSVFAIAATWLAVRLSHRTGILDRPGSRKVHRKPVAYLGGLGFTLTVLFGTALASMLAPHEALVEWRLYLACLLGLVAVFLVGLWDDVVGMRAWMKLLCQLLVALALWMAGVRVEQISFGLGSTAVLMTPTEGGILATVLANLPSLLITLGWYAALMNAINLIDGLDGLAGGVAMIGSLALGIVAVMGGGAYLTLGMALPMIAAGGCLGFLVFNYHPARIFLGDSGSLSIGYTLATGSLLASTKSPALMALLIPMVALGLPLFETVFSFFRRAIKGQSPFRADRRHLHHRLLDAGLDQRRVVFVFWYATLYFGVNAVLMARGESLLLLVNVIMISIGLVMLIEYLRFFEKKRNGATRPVATPSPEEASQ